MIRNWLRANYGRLKIEQMKDKSSLSKVNDMELAELEAYWDMKETKLKSTEMVGVKSRVQSNPRVGR